MKFVALLPVVIFDAALALALAQAPAGPATAQVEIAELLVAYPNTSYFWQQTDIARRLVAIGDPAVVDSIQLYLDTTDRRRRCNAAYVLAAFGDERGTQVLIRELEDVATDARDTREGAGFHTGPLSREVDLRRQVVADRYFAALLLGELRSKAAVPALIAATRDSTIDYRAAMSLGEIGDPSALPALREMIARVPEQKTWAGYALAALGDTQGFEVLKDALSNREWTRRREAIWALGKTLDAEAVPILLPSLRDEHANVRVAAAQELGKIGDPSALPSLRVALADHEVTQVNAPTTLAAAAQKAIEAIEGRARSTAAPRRAR
jgi:HEAT repeat protein